MAAIFQGKNMEANMSQRASVRHLHANHSSEGQRNKEEEMPLPAALAVSTSMVVLGGGGGGDGDGGGGTDGAALGAAGIDIRIITTSASAEELNSDDSTTTPPVGVPRQCTAVWRREHIHQDKSEEELREEYNTFHVWDIDVFGLSYEALCERIFAMMRNLAGVDLIASHGLDDRKLESFIDCVRTGYKENPYHSFFHGFHCFHATHYMLCSKSMRVLTPIHLVSLLIAALCHDIDHPGWNNAYEVNSGTSLADMYSDESVLERHHSAYTLQLLRAEGTDVFCSLDLDT
jgi:hypothetical protein